MKKEQLQQAAKEFCEAENIEYAVSTTEEVVQLTDILPKFLQSMIDQGKVFEAQDYESLKEASQKLDGLLTNIRSHADLSDFYIEWIDRVRNETDELTAPGESTVSSAGKEVKTLQECKDEVARNEFNLPCDSVFRVNRPYILDIAAEMYANQFKATPAKVITDHEIEKNSFNIDSPDEPHEDIQDAEIYGFVTGAKWYREQLNQQP